MTKNQDKNNFSLKLIFLLGLIFIAACESDNAATHDTQVINLDNAPAISVAPKTEHVINTEPIIENKSYLFDVSDHSISELEALLERADEISKTHPADFEELEIVMIIHGPDIDWFTQQNHEHNKQLIDLAERLDAYDVIDMKVCERTMQSRGVEKDDLPAFIEPVPFAPTEIKQRLQDGYINL